jgi:hypothetical protein
MTVASSIVLASDVRLMIPGPTPATGPSETDVTAVTNAQDVFIGAQREADAADAELVRAEGEWKRVARQLRWELEVSRDMLSAKEMVTSAQAAYEAATRPVLASLAERADYREACDAVARAREGTAEVSAHNAASFEQRVAAAQALLNRRAAVSKLEREAFENDPEVAHARSRRAAAAAHLRQVRSRLQRAVQEDPSYVAASQAMQDAEDKASAAERHLATAKLDLSGALNRVSNKEAARQLVCDWAKRHGLPDPP